MSDLTFEEVVERFEDEFSATTECLRREYISASDGIVNRGNTVAIFEEAQPEEDIDSTPVSTYEFGYEDDEPAFAIEADDNTELLKSDYIKRAASVLKIPTTVLIYEGSLVKMNENDSVSHCFFYEYDSGYLLIAPRIADPDILTDEHPANEQLI